MTATGAAQETIELGGLVVVGFRQGVPQSFELLGRPRSLCVHSDACQGQDDVEMLHLMRRCLVSCVSCVIICYMTPLDAIAHVNHAPQPNNDALGSSLYAGLFDSSSPIWQAPNSAAGDDNSPSRAIIAVIAHSGIRSPSRPFPPIWDRIMPTYEVDTDLLIHCKVRVTVEADSKDAAIDAVADLLPSNHDRDSAARWRATVEVKAPKGVRIAVLKAHHFEQASGAEKARKLAD